MAQIEVHRIEANLIHTDMFASSIGVGEGLANLLIARAITEQHASLSPTKSTNTALS